MFHKRFKKDGACLFSESKIVESKMLSMCNYGENINSAAVRLRVDTMEQRGIIYLISMTRIFRDIEKVALTRRPA